MIWQVNDWCIFDLNICQIKRIDNEGFAEVTDGSFCTSGKLVDRLRQLSVRNKAIIERFEWHYKELSKLDGTAGLNFPDIHQYFCDLARTAIDGDDAVYKAAVDKAMDFVNKATEYLARDKMIDGVNLFRRNLAK